MITLSDLYLMYKIRCRRTPLPFKDWYRQMLWPLCKKCQKPVDDFVEEQDFRTMQKVFIAKCHGDTDTAFMPSETFIFESVNRGYAFKQKRINKKGEFND